MYRFFIFFVLIGFLYADGESADAVIQNVYIYSSFNDFNAVEVYVDGYLQDAHYSGAPAYMELDVEYNDGSGWVNAASGAIDNRFFEPQTPFYGQVHYDAYTDINAIADNGNGNYRVKVLAICVTASDQSSYYYFSVNDSHSPQSPTSPLVTSSVNNHPLISWDASEAADLQHYKVYKRDPDSYPNFSYLATTTSTSYEDTEEEVAGEPAANQYDVDYRVTAVDYQDNESSHSSTVSIKVQGEPLSSWGESIALQNISINDFALAANHPNPFNPTTQISYALPEASAVTLEVFDVSGRKVSVVVKKSQEQGWHYATFDGGTLPSGIYIYRISATGMESGKRFTQAKRMLLVK